MEQEPHISFRFQNTLFVVAAAEMHSVLPVPELTVVPEQAACVSGVFNLRGVTVPVINLSEQLGRPDGSVQLADRVLLLNGSRGPLGILANEVLDMKLISTADLVPVPDFDESVALRLATRMARLGAQIGWLLRYGELWPLLAAQQQPADTGALRFAPAGGLDALAVFRQRAAALRPQAAAAATAKPLGLAVVTINHEYYGLELDLVREFCELGSVATVPCCPAHIVGNMNLRGEILTVVDIRHALRLPAATQDGGHSGSVVVVALPEFTAGLLVDAVVAVLYIDPQHCHPAPVTQSSGSSFISGTAAFDDHELCILNIPILLRHGGIIVNEPAQSAPDTTPAVHKQPTNIAVGPVTGATAASMAAAQVDALRPGAGKVAALHAQVSMLLKQVEQLVGFWEESMRGTRDAVAQSDNLKKQQVQNLEQLGSTLGQLRGSTYNNNAQLSVLVRDLTVHIHALGMLPLSSIFSRLPRMLHGIARSLSKDVQLVMAGGELTADMLTCDELADVIKHILRHVVENSLELPAQRVRAGKPATATIHLQALQTTTRLIVEITDDGAGLNEPAIKHMGLRKNLLRAEDANATPTCAASEPQVLQGLNRNGCRHGRCARGSAAPERVVAGAINAGQRFGVYHPAANWHGHHTCDCGARGQPQLRHPKRSRGDQPACHRQRYFNNGRARDDPRKSPAGFGGDVGGAADAPTSASGGAGARQHGGVAVHHHAGGRRAAGRAGGQRGGRARRGRHSAQPNS